MNGSKLCPVCGKIASWNSFFGGWLCSCGNLERKQKTNADRIRAMSDEELAELFCEADFCEICDQLRPTGTCMAMEVETEGPLSKHCIAAALRWIRQPAEGGGCDSRRREGADG